MAGKGQLKSNGTSIYPMVSLDNMVKSISDSSYVSVPTLDANGKIVTSYFPDGIEGGGGTGVAIETDITSLGSAGGVVVEPESAYLWDVVSNQTLSASGSVNAIGNGAFIRTRMLGGTITGTGNVVLNGALFSGLANDCEIEFRDNKVVVTPVWSGYEYTVTHSGVVVSSGYMNYGIAQGYKIIENRASDGFVLFNSNLNGGYIYNNSGGSLVIRNGAAGFCLINSGGLAAISSGVLTSNTRILAKGALHLSNFVSVYYPKIESGGSVFLRSGAKVYSAVVYLSGSVTISSGGIFSSGNVSSGNVFVSLGGTALKTNIYPGSLSVLSGGTAVSTTIRGDALLTISNGGIADYIFPKNGEVYIYSGGTAYNVSGGDYLNVSSGGKLISGSCCGQWYFRGIQCEGSDIQVGSPSGKVRVSAGASLFNVTINKSGYVFISSGGVVSKVVVDSKGNLYVSSGGSALNVRSLGGAKISVYTGGTITYA